MHTEMPRVMLFFSVKIISIACLLEAGCVDSVWSTQYHFPYWILSSVRIWIITSCPYFIIWEVLFTITR